MHRLFSLACLVAAGSGAELAKATGEVVPGEYVILMNANATEVAHTKIDTAVSGKKFSIGDNFKAIHATLTESALKWVLSQPDVDIVEPNQIVKLAQTACPNNQNQPFSWGQARVTHASPSNLTTFPYDSSWGNGVDAYVVDTGIRCTHVEFAGGRCVWGTNTAGGSNTDVNGHGTHCAGTIAGTTYGIAKQTTVIAVKVLNDQGSGTTAGVIEGVEFVATSQKTRRRPSTANMSLGGIYSQALNNAVNAAVGEGIPFAVAAGNENANACFFSPAAASQPVTVGATLVASDVGSSVDVRSEFSNFGGCTDIFAPGSLITAAWSANDNSYNTISGTSMASPHVCGVMAALLSADPTATADKIKDLILSNSVEGIIQDAGNNSPNRLLHLPC
eukprot:TRINITY_DN20087_c0_g1_i1.p1 TRINITY_DN20087_c0_g1~~TRINITY_DN20087_c0_g1_i1.p1  ORF type:complete len:390 (+),score=83.31 TRINITY_DN20087_c0_g1_i1:49-1218(+)